MNKKEFIEFLIDISKLIEKKDVDEIYKKILYFINEKNFNKTFFFVLFNHLKNKNFNLFEFFISLSLFKDRIETDVSIEFIKIFHNYMKQKYTKSIWKSITIFLPDNLKEKIDKIKKILKYSFYKYTEFKELYEYLFNHIEKDKELRHIMLDYFDEYKKHSGRDSFIEEIKDLLYFEWSEEELLKIIKDTKITKKQIMSNKKHINPKNIEKILKYL